MKSFPNKSFLLLILFLACKDTKVAAQINIPANTLVKQDFNSIGTAATASLPAEWKMSAAGTGTAAGYLTGTNISATTQAANSGTPATGGAYNWGTTTEGDRALGFLTTASYVSTNSILVRYRNTTGATVNAVTIGFNMERYITNTSTVSVAFFSSANGSSWTAQTAGDITTTDFPAGANAGTFAAPKTISRLVTINTTVANNSDIYFRWVFINTGNSNAQGLGLDDVTVFAGAATPLITAQLKDILQVDNGIIGVFNEGDDIRYETKVKNVGTGAATNVQVILPSPPANTTMVPGSVKTSAVANDDNYTTSFNSVLNGTTVLANDYGIPLPTVVQTFGPSANPAATTAGNSGVTDAGGTLLVNTYGSFTYTPPEGFSGTDHFKYITGNGNLPNNDAVVAITVGTDIMFSTTDIPPSCNGGTNGSITFNATGGNGTLTYSITGAAGTYQASNVFTGLAAGTYNLAVKDAGGYIKTGTTTLTNPAIIVVSGTIATLLYNTAISTITFTKTGGTGTITWSATGFPSGVTINSSTGAVTGTPVQTGTFNVVVTATDANGCTGTAAVSFNTIPNLVADAYDVTGNTQLVADGHSTPATPFTASATNILTNDGSDAAITVTAVTNAATVNGGTITINAAGRFTYTPPNGSISSDSYTYTATSNGVSATATITFTITNMVWFVNNTYSGANGAANGSSHRPYTSGTAAATASAANEVIYIHTGSGNTTGNVILKAGQTLRGAGTALSIGALSIAAGTFPTLTGTVTLANSVTADGFHMNTGTTTALTSLGATTVTVSIGNVTTSGAANAVSLTNTTGTVTIAGGSQTNSTGVTFNISGGTVALTYSGTITQAANAPMVSVSGGHATGTLTFQTGALAATNGTGLQFDNADGTYNFTGAVTLNGGDAGIDILNGSSGNFSFNNAPITNPSGTALNINGGNGTISHAGTISKNNAGRLINIQSRSGGSVTMTGNLSSTSTSTGINVSTCSGGTITFSGAVKTFNTPAITPVTLATNTGAAINFTGGNLALTSTTATTFNATGGGTISVQGTGNTITATTGTALNVFNTTIAAVGLNFQSISSNGSASGIILNSTGVGGLTVSGTGAANSGGSIQNCTGNGISLTAAASISLTYMNISGNLDDGINGTTVNGFTLANCSILNNGNSTTDEGIQLTNLSGTCSISNTTVTGSAHNNMLVANNTGTLSSLTVTNSVFSSNSVTTGNHGILIDMSGTATLTATSITGSTFNSNKVMGIQILGGDNAIITIATVTGCTFTSNQIGIDFAGANGPTMSLNFSNNTLTGHNSHAMNVFLGTPSTSTLTAKIDGNIIGNNAVAGSGSAIGNGIRINGNGNGTMIVSLNNNTIRQTPNGRGIEVIGRNGTGRIDVTITNNNVNTNDVSGFPLCAILVQSNTVTTTGYTVRADVRGNTVPTGTSFDVGTGFISLVETSTSNLQLVNTTASGTPTAQLTATNTGSVYANAGVALIVGPISVPPF